MAFLPYLNLFLFNFQLVSFAESDGSLVPAVRFQQSPISSPFALDSTRTADSSQTARCHVQLVGALRVEVDPGLADRLHALADASAAASETARDLFLDNDAVNAVCGATANIDLEGAGGGHPPAKSSRVRTWLGGGAGGGGGGGGLNRCQTVSFLLLLFISQ